MSKMNSMTSRKLKKSRKTGKPALIANHAPKVKVTDGVASVDAGVVAARVGNVMDAMMLRAPMLKQQMTTRFLKRLSKLLRPRPVKQNRRHGADGAVDGVAAMASRRLRWEQSLKSNPNPKPLKSRSVKAGRRPRSEPMPR